MKKVIAWLKESHRWQHLVGGLAIGLASDSNYCAALAGIGIASSLELKDKLWAVDGIGLTGLLHCPV